MTKGANTVKAYHIRTTDTTMEKTLEVDLKTAFIDYLNSIAGSYKELTFADGDTESETLEYLMNYDPDWEGRVISSRS